VPYDFELIQELCQESGLCSRIRSSDRLEVELGEGVVLLFQNAEREEDCAVGFEGMPWHVHEPFTFADSGRYIEMDYLDMVSGLKNGLVLVCERWRGANLLERWLIHCEYNDEFKYMEEGEEIRVRRAVTVLGPQCTAIS